MFEKEENALEQAFEVIVNPERLEETLEGMRLNCTELARYSDANRTAIWRAASGQTENPTLKTLRMITEGLMNVAGIDRADLAELVKEEDDG